ncbi:MAG: hypothetical protein PS018_24265 [bacterium]|nr:hypothetical protein [bacterium]
MASSAMAQSSRQEYPIPSNPGQDLTEIEHLFAPPTPPPLTAFPEFRERLKDTPAFLRDSKFNIEARSYYRDAVANAPASASVKEAWASGLGGPKSGSIDILPTETTKDPPATPAGPSACQAVTGYCCATVPDESMLTATSTLSRMPMPRHVPSGARVSPLTLL